MLYPQLSPILRILLLTLALSCAAIGIADARGSCGDWVAVGAEAVVVLDASDAFAPEREESRPTADEVCKQRARQSSAAVRVKAALEHTLIVASWLKAANSLFVDSLSLLSATARDSHASAHAHPRLQLKLQLGQAP